ncbi:MAG: filamentous hemagglutinin N-terminal domain-containing protein [Akkermansiaceae bacterium]|nr:filamentous hemagglutinin N-terminal domain-containing protein [Verrucomicrobiales bacterium]
MTVQNGSATAIANGNQLSVTASHNAFLNWNSFNIGAGETTRFFQPSASSIVWNRVNDQNPSQIYGNLQANGVVVLMNSSGFHFGPSSFVSAAGLVVTTAPVGPIESSAGLFWQFNGAPPSAIIVNHGQINVGPGGSAFLIAEHIQNHGTISAPEGNIGLFSGKSVLLSERPDGRGLSAEVRLPSGSIDNFGRLIADAGTIALHAKVVNQSGLIQANSIRDNNGVIELFASDAVNLGHESSISASGDKQTVSSGGKIIIKSEGTYADTDSSRIAVDGGGLGGNGGFVEVSAPLIGNIHSTIDGTARNGSVGGQLLIDPLNITIGNSGTGSVGSGTVNSGDVPAAGTLTLNVNSAFLGFSRITLQALNNITLAAGTTWDLLASTGISSPGSLLKLEAGNNITISSGASILAGENWSVTLQAGRNFSLTDAVASGRGNILLSGNGSLQALNGNINLLAGNNITVGSGHVRTIGGGNITAHAVGGSINTGTKANGFVFLPGGYNVSADLGGISTANGGDVSLTAGLDVLGYLPVAGGVQSDAGSGALGAAPANVTITAGRDIAGHYVVRNGLGVINAGRNAGLTTRLLALSLVKGGWTVNAANDILLQEVRNPNGVFNNLGSSSSATRHRFDYSPDAYTILNGGNSVQLRGTGLPRYLDVFSQGIPAIYPGTLEITAGAGGVVLGNDVILFPSPAGNLKITTTDGGSLVGTKQGDLTQLIVSDSGKTQYRAFGDFGLADRSGGLLHLNDPEPVRLNIDGDMSGIVLGVPKKAEVNIGGDMINSRFDGQNLHDSDETYIQVAGNVINRNEFTSVPSTKPKFSLFDPLLNLIYPPLTGGAAGVENLFTYNQATGLLTIQGRMTGDQLQALLNLRVRTFDQFGAPILNANGEPVTAPAEFVNPGVLQLLYAGSQDVPLNPDTGYRIGGGGTFNFTAHNLDLGATIGIVSQGPRANSTLATRFTSGADINVALSGDLDMFSTKIASLNGGNITVFAEGQVSVGSRDFTVAGQAARGIFTVDDSDVTVIARGNINVNGSRIAAYDGGNVVVRSLTGNVDAGTGAGGAATVEKIHVDPVTRQIRSYTPTIPGSGILATTFPPSLDSGFPRSVHPVGDILVETPQGSIIASAGGVVQIPLNGVNSSAGTVTLRAGTKDAAGNVIYEGDIDASGSGVIGSNVRLEASGDIKGLVFARDNLNISADQSVSVTALAVGNANVSAGVAITGTIIGVGSVSASGASVDAVLLSQNVSASGDVGSSKMGFDQANAAGSTSQSLQGDDQTKVASSKTEEEDEAIGKKQAGPRLAKTTGRVTVILPPKLN